MVGHQYEGTGVLHATKFFSFDFREFVFHPVKRRPRGETAMRIDEGGGEYSPRNVDIKSPDLLYTIIIIGVKRSCSLRT